MSKPVKDMVIADIVKRLGEARDLLVLDSSRLTALDANRFRLGLREKQIQALTVRNTLARKAFEQLGVSGLDPSLDGPSTLVWGGQDIVALSKEIAKWAKELTPLEIKGGSLEGTALSAADVDSLSKSPSREELIGQIVGLILSPGARLSAALLGPGAKLGSQIKKMSEEVAEEKGEIEAA